jgi:nucleoside-diphosphate-sugar epimerase
MKIGITGATGFLGRYITNEALQQGHRCQCWHRETSDRGGFEHATDENLTWLPGTLGDDEATAALVKDVDAVVHAALDHPNGGFRGSGKNVVEFVQKNVLGSLKLMAAARNANVGRFVFISTCAVHEVILDDRPLDEAHPLWANNHYGAHKAAIEKFVHSFGLGDDYPICALRPTGIYGLARPADKSKWYQLVQDVKAGKSIDSKSGGKEVHAQDVARAVMLLLEAEGIAGQAYNCYDMYIPDEKVASIARELTGSSSEISQHQPSPKHEIVTDKIQALGMSFGGEALLRETVQQMLDSSG